MNSVPNWKFVNSKTAKKVGRKIRASTKGSKNIDSPAKMSRMMRNIEAVLIEILFPLGDW